MNATGMNATGMNASVVLERVRRVVAAVPYVFVCTNDGAGGVSARQVQPLQRDDDLTIWFGTSPRSRKVRELVAAPSVTVTLDLAAEVTTVVLKATATVHDDLAVRQARWLEGLRAFFPGGPEGDDFVMVELRPHRAELIDFTNGFTPDPYGLVPVVLGRSDEGWDVHPAERG